MSGTGSDLPEHEKAAWDAIVADLSGQIDLGPEFPRDSPKPPAAQTAAQPAPPEAEDVDEDEGYVPPTPPPIPKPSDAIGRFSWAAVIVGPLLVLITTLLEWDRWMADLGVILSIGGFVSLIWRMNDRDEDDDGAVV